MGIRVSVGLASRPFRKAVEVLELGGSFPVGGTRGDVWIVSNTVVIFLQTGLVHAGRAGGALCVVLWV